MATSLRCVEIHPRSSTWESVRSSTTTTHWCATWTIRRSLSATRSAERSPRSSSTAGSARRASRSTRISVRGILKLPFSQLRAGFPVLKNPSNIHKAVALTAEQFHYAFTNTLSDTDSKAAYERYAVPGPGRVLFQGALANFNPHSPDAVDFKRKDRAPLL